MQNILVTPGKNVVVEVTSPLVLTLVSMKHDTQVQSGRTVLYLSTLDENDVKGEKIAIAPISFSKYETAVIDYKFDEGNKFILTAEGDFPVTVLGFSGIYNGVIISEL